MKQKAFSIILIIMLAVLVVVIYSRVIIPQFVEYPLMNDIAQDYIGAQAMLNSDAELYPILGPTFARIGIDWPITHRSTHPPTTYLMVVPLARLNYPVAQLIWMMAMFVCIVVSFWALGLTWGWSLLAGVISLAWPPGIWSLGQLTPIWLLGVALAYRHRERPLLSGVWIAVASLPKFMAAPALLYSLWRRKWSALIGFVAVWVVALGAVLVLRGDAISAFVNSSMGNSLEQILRPDNGALMMTAWRVAKWPGVVVAGASILAVLWLGVQRDGFWEWGCLVWVGIALLPLAWTYSLFPLVPWLFKAFRSSDTLLKLLTLVALFFPYGGPLPGSDGLAITLSIIFSGLTLVLLALRERGLKDKSLKAVTN
jgi:hypothetical protein